MTKNNFHEVWVNNTYIGDYSASTNSLGTLYFLLDEAQLDDVDEINDWFERQHKEPWFDYKIKHDEQYSWILSEKIMQLMDKINPINKKELALRWAYLDVDIDDDESLALDNLDMLMNLKNHWQKGDLVKLVL